MNRILAIVLLFFLNSSLHSGGIHSKNYVFSNEESSTTQAQSQLTEVITALEPEAEEESQEIITDPATVKVAEQQEKGFYPELDTDASKAEFGRRVLEYYLNTNYPFSSPFSKKIIEIIKSNLLCILSKSDNMFGMSASIAFSPVEKILASTLRNNSTFKNNIKLWDTESKREIATFSSFDDAENVAFSSNGKTIAFGDDKTIKLWDIASKEEIPTLFKHYNVRSIAFSPDGKIVASGSYSSIKLWDITSKREITTLFDGANSLAFSPDGKTLASGQKSNVWWSHAGSIRLWNMANYKEICTLYGHKDTVNSVAFSPDGKILASGSSDNTIILWDMANKSEIARLLYGPLKFIDSVAFSPDGKMLASGSQDNTIKLWNMSNNTEIATLSGPSRKGFLCSVAFSPDGKMLASASGCKTIKLRDMQPFSELPEFLKSLCTTTKGLKKFLLLNAIVASNANKDGKGNPKEPKPLDLYQPEAIALLKDLPLWLQKQLQKKQMVRVFTKKRAENKQ